MIKKSIVLCVVPFIFAATSWAEQNYIEPPIIPEPFRDGEIIEPDVKIIQKKDSTIQEYRINGKLYMIKVTPKIGRTYFLMDTDGDGSLESRQNELVGGSLVPNWILLEW